MAEAKSRPTTPRPRTRSKPETPPEGADLPPRDPETSFASAEEEPAPEPPAESPGPKFEEPPVFDEEGYEIFDEEINSRYEEIKRGSTHISELQAMTMPQLLKVAREEGLT